MSTSLVSKARSWGSERAAGWVKASRSSQAPQNMEGPDRAPLSDDQRTRDSVSLRATALAAVRRCARHSAITSCASGHQAKKISVQWTISHVCNLCQVVVCHSTDDRREAVVGSCGRGVPQMPQVAAAPLLCIEQPAHCHFLPSQDGVSFSWQPKPPHEPQERSVS